MAYLKLFLFQGSTILSCSWKNKKQIKGHLLKNVTRAELNLRAVGYSA